MNTIRDVYYNFDSPACFAGEQSVYRESKKRNKNIRLKDVRDFLANQPAYTRHKQTIRRFKRNKMISSGFDADWQSDLADLRNLKKENSNYTYILICVDVFSRHAFAEPIKNKTAVVVGEAFERILKKSDRKPGILTTDGGKEYTGEQFQLMLRKYYIQHKVATSPDVKCAIAERWIRTLKSRMWRHFTRNKTLRYVDVLPALVKAINSTINRSIKRAPATITRENQNELREKPTVVKKPPKFKAGDSVRIAIEKHKLSKGYWPNYSSEIFTVSRVMKRRYPVTYKLKDDTDEELVGIFYNEELVRVLQTDQPVRVIKKLEKSEHRNGDLWHLVKFENSKKSSWIRNDALVSI